MQQTDTPGPNESERMLPTIEGVGILCHRVEELEAALEVLRSELSNARERPYRKRLPTTRQSITHKFEIGQHEGYITVGLYEDGRPGELFLTMAKEGSTIGGLMDTVGILTSLALQQGVSVETLARKFEHASFEPSGWTRNAEIRRAASTVDYVFRWLGMEFCEAYRREKLAIHERVPQSASRCDADADDEEARALATLERTRLPKNEGDHDQYTCNSDGLRFRPQSGDPCCRSRSPARPPRPD